MFEHNLEFGLPLPWTDGIFKTERIGAINFLVGPNGSGKSQFANQLFHALPSSGLPGQSPNRARLLGTDRLSGMDQVQHLSPLIGDPFSSGYAKQQFRYFREAGTQGSGIDTIVLLEERLDLRIRIEATLGHFFGREITLEWDSGNLVPNVTRIEGGSSYRLDREECHGIKELLVLLTHLYDDQYRYLIVDEPELHLHPQHQALFIQEARKIAGDPHKDHKNKIVVLVTHSPFILDLQSSEDIESIISFDLEYSVPKQIGSLGLNISSSTLGVLRMNAHHKQFFFSDNPVFVEGIYDASLIQAMMAARGVSVASAGSCVIDVGGTEEATQYLEFCKALGKTAHFFYDLDSLFRRTFRRSIGQDEEIQSFLTSAGLGSDFVEYCGQLDRALTDLIDSLLDCSLTHELYGLQQFLESLGERRGWSREMWSKARTATMTAISRYRAGIVAVSSQSTVDNIEGRLGKIVTALRERNIHVLPGGTLERYLPHFAGDEYSPSADAKRNAALAEIVELANLSTDEALLDRYGELYRAVCQLPSKEDVDLSEALRNHLSDYIHQFQRVTVQHPSWQEAEIQERLDSLHPATRGIFRLSDFSRTASGNFSAAIIVKSMLGKGSRMVRVDERTNAGVGDFSIEAKAAD